MNLKKKDGNLLLLPRLAMAFKAGDPSEFVLQEWGMKTGRECPLDKWNTSNLLERLASS